MDGGGGGGGARGGSNNAQPPITTPSVATAPTLQRLRNTWLIEIGSLKQVADSQRAPGLYVNLSDVRLPLSVAQFDRMPSSR